MPEIIFTRAAAPDRVYLSRANSEDWQVSVRALLAQEAPRPIVLHRTFAGLNYITLDLTEAEARALAHELLHAADVAEAAKKGGAQ